MHGTVQAVPTKDTVDETVKGSLKAINPYPGLNCNYSGWRGVASDDVATLGSVNGCRCRYRSCLHTNPIFQSDGQRTRGEVHTSPVAVLGPRKRPRLENNKFSQVDPRPPLTLSMTMPASQNHLILCDQQLS